MTTTNFKLVRERLQILLTEMHDQLQVANYFGDETLSLKEEIEQIREFVDVGEYGIAYESIVSALESAPFNITGHAAVSLLELGLLFGYKSEKSSDSQYDRRKSE